MSPETPDFAASAQALAEAVTAVYPDLTFTQEEGAVTILAGGLKLVVAAVPTPEAEPLNEALDYDTSLTGDVDALIRQYGYEGKMPPAAYPPGAGHVFQGAYSNPLDYWYAVAAKVKNGQLQRPAVPQSLNEAAESLNAYAMPRRGAYAGEQAHVRAAGYPGARQAFRREAAIDQDVDALTHMDFDAVPAGDLQPIEYKALCKARLRAQQLMLAQPTNEKAKAVYAELHQRWVAENEAQRAQQAADGKLGGYQAPLGIKGYEGD